MINVLSPDEIKKAEQKIIDSGIIEDELIKRAGKLLSAEVEKVLPPDNEVLCVCGSGNNGSDALEVALLLHEKGVPVAVLLASEKTNEHNAKRRRILKNLGVKFVQNVEKKYGVIVDGIFGIGFSANRILDEQTEKLIENINDSGAFILSADIPSGLDSASGKINKTAVKANKTLTFSGIKVGMLIGIGRNYCGEISVGEIGIECNPIGQINQPPTILRRPTQSHKGSFGRVKIIGGNENMVGAPYLAHQSATACLRAGAGLCTLCVAEELKFAYAPRVVENMLYYLPSQNGKILFNRKSLDGIMANANAIAIGMGMGNSEDTAKCVEYLANNFDGVLVVDADGINSIAQRLNSIKNHKCKLIFTPHLIEFYRLINKTSDELISDAKNFAKEFNCVVAVKSATTVITDGASVLFNITGTPAMAKGGSGDVLSGIVSAFACIESPLQATARACYEFGKAGERASRRLNSEVSVLASDVIVEL